MCLYLTPPLDTISIPTPLTPPISASTDKASILFSPYTSTTNYYTPAAALPNSIYASTGPHPSEYLVGKVEPESSYPKVPLAYMDSVFTLGNSSTMIPTTEFDSHFVGSSVHMYTMTTCENIGACAPTALVGSICGPFTARGQVYQYGFCYKAAAGTMQCGRSIAVTPRYGGAATTLPYNPEKQTTLSRCPAGTPLEGPGKVSVKSLIVGGCMIAGDTNFAASAEIHVPEACSTPTPAPAAAIGCPFPGALNYKPGAYQYAKCLYNVVGCTSATALNYNSEAHVNDGSCIEPVAGCTVPSLPYTGMESATPGFTGLYVGKPLGFPAVTGRVNYPAYATTTNYLATANVLSSCTMAIEGCMDPTAVNYDSKATVNTNTWCVPKVNGCMIPGRYTSTVKDFGSANYMAAATVNVPSMCSLTPSYITVVNSRLGCMVSTAINYDPYATVNATTAATGKCFPIIGGCFDAAALNYMCSTAASITPCSLPEAAAPTYHVAEMCVYTVSPPPAPRPAIPEGAATREVVQVEILASGTVSDYTPTALTAIGAQMAITAGVPGSSVRVSVIAASVKIVTEIDVAAAGSSAPSAAAISSSLGTAMASPEAATAFLASAGVTGVTVLAIPTVATVSVPVITPPGPPPAAPVGAIVGGVIGGIVAILLVGAVYIMMKKRKAGGTTYPA